MDHIKKICVLGGGSFGTAMANIAANNHSHVMLWMRSDKRVDEIKRTRINGRYLPNYPLNDSLIPTSDLEEACADADLVLVAIPSKAFRGVMEQAIPLIPTSAPLVSLTKGIEHGSFKLMSQILQELAPKHDIAVLSGPNLAKEIADDQLCATVIASINPELRRTVQEVLAPRASECMATPTATESNWQGP